MGWSARLARALASGLGAGFAPVAPGTAGTLAAVPLVWALERLSPGLHALVLVASVPLAAAVCGFAARSAGQEDPCWIVLDEVVGFAIATAWVTPRVSAYVAAFLLFRVFDIIKPPPAGWVDRHMPGGWGILLDDVLAGLYTRVLLSVLAWVGAL